MNADLYATICTPTTDTVLQPFGDPHLHRLPCDDWRFDGHALRYELRLPRVTKGDWHLVGAIGHEPYGHNVGVFDLGRFKFRSFDGVAVSFSIDLNFPSRDVTIQRPMKEIAAPRKELPGAMRMLIGKR